MNILISGGNGLIGSHLTERLLNRGHTVIVVDNYESSIRGNLASHPLLQLIEDTIVNEKTLSLIFEKFKPDIVVHAAASYTDPTNWHRDSYTNIIGTLNLLKLSLTHKVTRFIYFQTALCYGLTPLEQPITFSHPLFSGGYDGGSSYAISKTTAELYLTLSGLNFISFRLANAYGPRGLNGPIPAFYKRLTNKQPCLIMDSKRDFVFVDDVIDVVEQAIYGVGTKQYYHISSGLNIPIKDIYLEICNILGVPIDKEPEIVPRSKDDVETILLDSTDTINDFNWAPKTSLKEGIKTTINYYLLNGVPQTFTHLTLKHNE